MAQHNEGINRRGSQRSHVVISRSPANIYLLLLLLRRGRSKIRKKVPLNYLVHNNEMSCDTQSLSICTFDFFHLCDAILPFEWNAFVWHCSRPRGESEKGRKVERTNRSGCSRWDCDHRVISLPPLRWMKCVSFVMPSLSFGVCFCLACSCWAVNSVREWVRKCHHMFVQEFDESKWESPKRPTFSFKVNEKNGNTMRKQLESKWKATMAVCVSTVPLNAKQKRMLEGKMAWKAVSITPRIWKKEKRIQSDKTNPGKMRVNLSLNRQCWIDTVNDSKCCLICNRSDGRHEKIVLSGRLISRWHRCSSAPYTTFRATYECSNQMYGYWLWTYIFYVIIIYSVHCYTIADCDWTGFCWPGCGSHPSRSRLPFIIR